MANTNPRRPSPGLLKTRPRQRVTAENKDQAAPWRTGDPERKVYINCPFPEPVMMQIEWLIENKAVFSKAAFIRDAVAKAATEEIERLHKVRAVLRKMKP